MIPRIGLTLGDPAGIGPEVLLKSLKRTEAEYIPIIIGSLRLIQMAKDMLNETLEITPLKSFRHIPRGINIYDCVEPDFESIRLGEESKESGRVSYLWVGEAVKLALNGVIDAIVTAPISKSSWRRAGYRFPGHTELLAELTKTKKYAMMMVAESLRVLLLTTHIPLGEVYKRIARTEIENKILLADDSLRNLFKIPNPRIAVCALNPHRGEDGILGREEIEVIEPAVESCRSKGVEVEGPFSSDTIFLRRSDYDCILAMYHDQGLIPFKLLSFGKGVNLTLGLPFIRTSPDHGTAYEIAGKGVADPSSMTEAIRLAVRLVKNKNQI